MIALVFIIFMHSFGYGFGCDLCVENIVDYGGCVSFINAVPNVYTGYDSNDCHSVTEDIVEVYLERNSLCADLDNILFYWKSCFADILSPSCYTEECSHHENIPRPTDAQWKPTSVGLTTSLTLTLRSSANLLWWVVGNEWSCFCGQVTVSGISFTCSSIQTSAAIIGVTIMGFAASQAFPIFEYWTLDFVQQTFDLTFDITGWVTSDNINSRWFHQDTFQIQDDFWCHTLHCDYSVSITCAVANILPSISWRVTSLSIIVANTFVCV